MAGVKQRAEVAGFLAKGEQLVDHAVDRAGQHQARRHGVGGDGFVGLALVQLEQVGAAGKTHQLANQLLEVKVVRAFGAMGIAPRQRVVLVGHKNTFGHAPVGCIGRPAGLGATFDVARPVALDPFGQQEIGRDRIPAPGCRGGDAFGKRRDRRDDDGRVRRLKGLEDDALADFRDHGAGGADVEVFALQVVRRMALPDGQHHVDDFDKHVQPVLAEVAEDFSVRSQAARTDAHDEAALQHVVKHGDVGGHGCGMAVGHVDGARAELDLLGLKGQAAQEHQAGRDVFGQVRDVLADIGFRVAESVGQEDGLAVLAQGFTGNAARWMQGHHECSKFHRRTRP